MNSLKNIFKILFSILYREVVFINSSGPSRLYIFFIYFLFFYQLTTYLTNSICMYRNTPPFFSSDLMVGKAYQSKVIRANKYLPFLDCYTPFYHMRVFYLVYISGDRHVWEHFYDLVVRNRDQIILHLFQTRHSRRSLKNWFSKLTQLCPRLKVQPSWAKLTYYPYLNQKIRFKCILLYSFEEAHNTLVQFLYFTLHLLSTYKIAVSRWLSDGVFQVFLVIFFNLTSRLAFYFINNMLGIMLFTLYLTCYVYNAQYKNVNRDLAMAKVRFCSEGKDYYRNLLMISRAAAVFRTLHTRLTVFILRYNNSIISKIFAAYLTYMPVHGYRTLLYYQQNDLPGTYVFHNFFIQLQDWIFLSFVTFVVVKVNSKIVSSGKKLGAIFAGKGVLSLVAKRNKERRQCNWLTRPSELAWSREAFKLATYYELIWRVDNELAITASQRWTINWKFILDVSLEIETSLVLFTYKYFIISVSNYAFNFYVFLCIQVFQQIIL